MSLKKILSFTFKRTHRSLVKSTQSEESIIVSENCLKTKFMDKFKNIENSQPVKLYDKILYFMKTFNIMNVTAGLCYQPL